jgi:hypothetical protein
MRIYWKECSKCEKYKELEEFNKRSSTKDGYRPECKECQASNNKTYRSNNTRVRIPTSGSSQYRARVAQIRRDFNLSEEQIVCMMDEQSGCCGICGDSLVYPESIKTYCIDHCHSTGGVRGLLCSNCNAGIGLLGDTLDSVKKAVKYLEECNDN